MTVFNSTSVLIDSFLHRLRASYSRVYGGRRAEHVDIIHAAGLMAMEIIANSDALYHDVEHSMMVTLVGQEILLGKYLREGGVEPLDWTHFIISLCCHDIGYVRGICPGDREGIAVIDAAGNTVAIPPGATDAFLTPYHVERGKLFIRFRFRDHPIVDVETIVANIENTRFPVPHAGDPAEGADYPGLVRAADLIGQLADPDYLRKLPALFHEFEETGAAARIGCASAEDLRDGYPDFYWKMVSDHVAAGVEYLRGTQEGRQWVAGLYSNIFSQEHRNALRAGSHVSAV